MELAVLSGKGGTGKTTIATALSELAKDIIRVDCDVDAPNFYLFYDGVDTKKRDFVGGQKAYLNSDMCIECGKCESVCRFDAIENFKINSFLCEGCGACELVCPSKAIEMKDEKVADTFITELADGPLSRANMEIGSDGSGKLITQLRKNGKEINKENKLTIIDGSPGIGCAVIASVTGCDSVLVVTEPTKSGMEDLMRITDLCEYFGIFTMACINKYDINEGIASEIEEYIIKKNIKFVGKIPFDKEVKKSINELKPITQYADSSANKAIRHIWDEIEKNLGGL